MARKKLVVLTGAGISVESGLSTFRDNDGLWDRYPVEQVASHDGWLRDPDLVNRFYNERRRQLFGVQPNRAHRLLAELERTYDVTIVTQNVDDLHERAGSSHVIHLHGELLKVCSSRDVDNPHFIRTLTPRDADVQPGEKAGDGSLLRPYIVFFGEAVPNMERACQEAMQADIFAIIGSSLVVYPAAGLVQYAPSRTPIYVIDPQPVEAHVRDAIFIQKTASAGVAEMIERLAE